MRGRRTRPEGREREPGEPRCTMYQNSSGRVNAPPSKGATLKDINKIFEPRTWQDVRSSITRNTARRWPQMSEFDVDDAVSAAMLDLIDYWVNLKSSISDDPQRNFAYAVTRGTWQAKAALGVRRNEIDTTTSLDELEFLSNEPEQQINELALEPFADYTSERPQWIQSPSAEDVLFDHLQHDELIELINNLDESELENWFSDFWSGESLTEIAKRDNITLDAVRKRRTRGLDKLANKGL